MSRITQEISTRKGVIPVSGHWDDTSGHCRHKGTSVSYSDDTILDGNNVTHWNDSSRYWGQEKAT